MTAVCIASGASIMLGNELGADHIKEPLNMLKVFYTCIFSWFNTWNYFNFKYTIIIKNV